MRRRDLLALSAALGLAPGALHAVTPAGGTAAPGQALRTHALSLLGEPALPADFTHFPWVNPAAPKGGEIALTALGTFDSFNAYILRGTPAVGLSLLYDTLLANSPDEASTEYPYLAQWIDLPADRLSISFELNPAARWHDGRPVTAADVVFTFNALRTHGRPFFRSYWGDVTEVVAEAERRVTFRFRSNENRELGLILGQMPVLPAHWWEGRDFARPLLDVPLGSGPYRLERFDAGRSLVYARVPDWWAKDIPSQKGTQNFDVQRFEYFRDTTVALEAFKAGQIDFRTENSARDWATGYDFPAVRRGLVKRDELRHELPTGMQAFAMNLRRPLFQDARVRRALIELFDYEWMNANLFYGSYTRTTSYFSNSDLASSGLPIGAELAVLEPFRGRVPEAVFTTEYKLPVTDGSGNNREGLRTALRLLQAAGWRVQNRRLVGPQGQPFEFEILLQGATYERIALPYVQALERIGMTVRVRTVDPAQYQTRVDAFDYDMTVEVVPQSLSPGNEQRDFFTCAKAQQPGSQNVAGICDPAIDELVELVVNAPDRGQLVARTRALDRVLLWHDFMIPNWHLQSFRIAFWDKFGRPARNPRYGLGLESWWVDAEKDRALSDARRTL
ncbi:extracellular solute-binding protein [Falsiroseomonas selenitidurans]|uniref:ABC transporter substrate-binding protein n=1 Tax=Falsiroseomonas selenitidurans TaxID=2716335 RepID=A0ABX1EA80_9PROT|nr:extracellular solute-binding protein [Falsiroseomonas selenitidurans]NKC32678.1 ABC transporter substrate-binding protein [Falsiroseomonas selenitidurans]